MKNIDTTGRPRLYRENVRNDYLNLEKRRKRSAKKIRDVLMKQLNYARSNLRYIDEFFGAGCELTGKQEERLTGVLPDVFIGVVGAKHRK